MFQPWRGFRIGEQKTGPLDVDIEVPELVPAQRAFTGDPPTAPIDPVRVARASALARADTMPVLRVTQPVPLSPVEPNDDDTTDIAYVGAGLPLAVEPTALDAESDTAAPVRVIDVKKAIWLMAGLVMLAVLATAAILGIDYGSKRLGPKAIAMQYANLVVQGKVEEASALAKHTNDGGPLISDSVYAAAMNRPASATVTAFTRDGKNAAATVQYTLADGSSLEEDYHLQANGRKYLLFENWRFEPFALPTVQISSTAPGTVTAAGADISSAATISPQPLAAYPGSYPVEYSDPSGMFSPTKKLITTTGSGELATLELTPEPDATGRAAATKQAQEQVDSVMDRCVKSKLLDAECGAPLNAIGAAYRGRDVTMAVKDRPKVEVRYVEGAWNYAALKGHIAVEAEGQTYEHVFNSIGTLTLDDDGTVTLQPSPLPTPGSTPGATADATSDENATPMQTGL